MGLVGLGGVTWPLVDSLNPARDVVAMSTVQVDLSSLEPGQRLTVIWQKSPVFIDRRTDAQIALAQGEDIGSLKDPETADERVKRPEWLIVIGVCTHLGCIPLGQVVRDPRGDWDGWFCPCHGSHYDNLGRIRKGPAPENLVVPPYRFVTDTTVMIG